MRKRKDDPVYTPKSVGVGIQEDVELPVGEGVVLSLIHI